MKKKTVRCPYCGARLNVFKGATRAFCGFDISGENGCHESFDIARPHKKGAKKNVEQSHEVL